MAPRSPVRPARLPSPLAVLVVLAVGAGPVGATSVADGHPGHGTKVVLGILREAARDVIVVEVRDIGTGSTSRVRVRLTEDTRYRLDKERLTSLDGMVGQRAIVAVEWEDDERGGQTLTATEVRFNRPKK